MNTAARSVRNACIIALYRGGSSLRELGREFGLSHVGVWAVLKRNGIRRRRVGVPAKLAR